jgi:FAD/FMN-containing dehydrogenase
MRRIARREALALAAGLGTATVVAACTRRGHASVTAPAGTSPSGSSGRAAATPDTPAPRTSVPGPSPAGPDWAGLAGQLRGRLLRKTTSGYATAARLYNPRFDATARPSAIVAAATASDVAVAVRFAANARVPFAVRSGGHSYPGWSTSPGLVIDVSSLTGISVDSAHRTARIGAGARLVQVYAGLAAKGVGIAGGSCPSVGIAGLTLGGGIGVLGRAWGLACDAVRSVDIVTADGAARTVDARHDADLFWALRGGGGGSFGAVTAFTVDVRPVPTVSTFYLQWPFTVAADVVEAWQGWAHTADSRLFSTCKLLADPRTGTRRALVAGTWIGPSSDLSARLAPLRAKLPKPSSTSIHAHTYADAMLLEAGCSGQSATSCLAGALAPAKRQPFAATSSIVAGPLPSAAIAMAVTNANDAMNVAGIYEGGVSFDSLGGAIGAVGGGASAFGHRDAVATAQYTATWTDTGASPARFDAYVRGFRSALAPWLGSAAYVNYADASITNFGPAYWGSNYPRLQSVKRTYDPHNLFTFPQSVRLPGA